MKCKVFEGSKTTVSDDINAFIGDRDTIDRIDQVGNLYVVYYYEPYENRESVVSEDQVIDKTQLDHIAISK